MRKNFSLFYINKYNRSMLNKKKERKKEKMREREGKKNYDNCG